MFGKDKVIYKGSTEHGEYMVVDMIYSGRKARVLFTGDRSAAFSGMPLDDGHELLFDYIQRLFELVAYTRPRKVLMIGGGVYTLPIALLHALPDIRIDAVEIDSGLDAIAEAFFGLQESERMRIFHDDGRVFLEKHKETYDMIIVDAFSQLDIPSSMTSADTARLIKDRLTTNGIMAMNVISAYRGRSGEIIRRIYNAYNETFDAVTVYPADSGQSLWSSQNFILLAKKGKQKDTYGLRYGPLEPPDRL